jgi:hypothetical protein
MYYPKITLNPLKPHDFTRWDFPRKYGETPVDLMGGNV